MVTEIELKYSLLKTKETAENIKDIVSQVFSDHELSFSYQEKHLSNAYYDTNDLALRKSRISLRTRGTTEPGKTECFEQTIKTSGTVIAGLHQRPEYNVDIDNDKPILSLFPDSIWQENTDLTGLQQSITELFATNFNRHTWLVDIDNSQVEVAFDCGEIVCAGNHTKPSIYEIELELFSGNAETLFALTKLLVSQLNLRPGQLTKAARGYALFHQAQDKTTEAIKKALAPITDVGECIKLNDSFTQCIAYALKHLQLSVDHYVIATQLSDKVSKLQSVVELLKLLQQLLGHFSETLSAKELSEAKVLESILQSLLALNPANESELVNEAEILSLLHSDTFNNIQLSLLSALLRRNNNEK